MMNLQSSVLKSNNTSAVTVGGKRKIDVEEIELKNQFEPHVSKSVVIDNNDTKINDQNIIIM